MLVWKAWPTLIQRDFDYIISFPGFVCYSVFCVLNRTCVFIDPASVWVINKLEAKGRKKKQCLILPKLLPQASVLKVSSNRFFYLCFLIPPEESQADHA